MLKHALVRREKWANPWEFYWGAEFGWFVVHFAGSISGTRESLC